MSESRGNESWPEVLEVEEMAQYLRLGRDHAYELCRNPAFPAIKVGRRYLIPLEALRRWLLTEALKGTGIEATSGESNAAGEGLTLRLPIEVREPERLRTEVFDD